MKLTEITSRETAGGGENGVIRGMKMRERERGGEREGDTKPMNINQKEGTKKKKGSPLAIPLAGPWPAHTYSPQTNIQTDNTYQDLFELPWGGHTRGSGSSQYRAQRPSS